MNLINDYFLLYHGKEIPKDIKKSISKIDIDLDDFYTINALILCINRKNYNKYMALNSFKKLISKISNLSFNTIDDFYCLQYEILELQFDKNIKYKQKIIDTLSYLFNEKILLKQEYEKLESLFMVDYNKPKEKIILQSNNKENFLKCNDNLNIIIEKLYNLFVDKKDLTKLDTIKNNLINKKFSIGITGIMNSGKSSMLNALMKKSILGTSVIPETANLTIIKYTNNDPNAKIFYWNKKEWDDIEKSSATIESIDEFIKETKTKFKNDFESYISENRISKTINIKDLANYTSANNEEKTSNLIKYIELSYKIDFLKDGIEIVDTPGLDDPVIQREEITKEYLNNCDMLFHLMNVSQSATNKDIEFIINTLLYQNISKLLIIITRIDMVNNEQLQDVINYTKSSIKKQLNLQNKNDKLSYILNNIDFICISSKIALMHYDNKSNDAINLGYDLPKTGIPSVINYVNDTLYKNKSSKGTLLLNNIKLSLTKLISSALYKLNYELEVLNMNEDDLNILFENLKSKKVTNKDKITLIKEAINIYEDDAKSFIYNLDTFLLSKIEDLKNILIHRLFSNIKYSFEQDNEISISSLKIILDTTVKDGIIDVIREYKYKYNQKLIYLKENCNKKYNNIGFEIINKKQYNILDNLYIDFSTNILFEQIKNEVKKINKLKLDNLKQIITSYINIEFEKLNNKILNQTDEITKKVLKNFSNDLNEPLNTYINKLSFEEKLLTENIKKYKNNEELKTNQSIKIHNKIKQLNNIQESLII